MYVILVYDVNEIRVSKVNKFLKRFLHWIQNSVFEGELSLSQIEKVKEGIKEIIDVDEDCVRIYILPSKKYMDTLTIGIEKNDTEMII